MDLEINNNFLEKYRAINEKEAIVRFVSKIVISNGNIYSSKESIGKLRIAAIAKLKRIM